MIGSSMVALNGRPYLQDPVTGPGSGEINLGDLITDAMVWKVAQNPNFEAQFGANVIAVTNTGGVRVNLPPGTLTRGQVMHPSAFFPCLVKLASGERTCDAIVDHHCARRDGRGFSKQTTIWEEIVTG
jgi:2',3'-cyclic-nucleotide 2'-phosphodiesterase (5'-nucleotidase family)